MGFARWRAQRRQLPIAADVGDTADFLVAPTDFVPAPDDGEPAEGPVVRSFGRPARRPGSAGPSPLSDAAFEASLVLDHEFDELDELVDDDPETFSTWVAEAAESVAVGPARAPELVVELDLELELEPIDETPESPELLDDPDVPEPAVVAAANGDDDAEAEGGFHFEMVAALVEAQAEADAQAEAEATAAAASAVNATTGPTKGREPIIVPGVLAAMWPSPDDGPRDADAAELSKLLFPEHGGAGDRLVH
jgi:hypothetical protein